MQQLIQAGIGTSWRAEAENKGPVKNPVNARGARLSQAWPKNMTLPEWSTYGAERMGDGMF